MAFTVQSTSSVMQKQTIETSPSLAPARTPADQPRIFPGQISYGDTRTARYERSVNETRGATGNGPAEPAKTGSDVGHNREKRGQVLGACGGSRFRDCRGGDALEEHAATHVKFDQFNHDRTKGGVDGKGSCQGIVFEAMRRIDRATDNAETADTLPSAVRHMNSDMDTLSAVNPGGIYDRIDRFQERNSRPPLTNYRQSSSVNLNPSGDSSRAERINGLIDSLGDMPQGGLAYIRVGIRPAATMGGPETNGHALLAQHLPGGSQYALFDPNNGVFTYNNLLDMQAALSGYMHSAFAEDGNAAAPDSVHFYTPPTARDWRSAMPATQTPPPGSPMPEPRELLQHFGLDHSGL